VKPDRGGVAADCIRHAQHSHSGGAESASRIVTNRPQAECGFGLHGWNPEVIDVIAIGLDTAITGSLAAAGAAGGEEKADECPGDNPGGHNLIETVMQDAVDRPRAIERLAAGQGMDFPGPVNAGGEALTGFFNLFAGHIGGCRHQRACVVGQLFNIMNHGLCWFVH
jgi:hypothetical protein